MGDSNTIAGLMYLVQILGFPIGPVVAVVLWATKKDDAVISYHFKQLLILMIVGYVAGLVSALLIFVLIGFILLPIVGIATLVLWIMGMINAFKGEQKPLPIIGKWGESFKF